MPEVGLGEGAREGKGAGRKSAIGFTNSRKVTQPLSVPSESDVIVHGRHYVTWLYINNKKHGMAW